MYLVPLLIEARPLTARLYEPHSDRGEMNAMLPSHLKPVTI
jgi:hypothetical protein